MEIATNSVKEKQESFQALANAAVSVACNVPIPIIKDAATIVDKILVASQKVKNGQAICKFIAKNVKDTQKILEQNVGVHVNEHILKKYINLLRDIENYIDNVQKLDVWKKIKNILSADEVNFN